jgi:hypothetical protein
VAKKKSLRFAQFWQLFGSKKKASKNPQHFIKLEIPAKLPAKNPIKL